MRCLSDPLLSVLLVLAVKLSVNSVNYVMALVSENEFAYDKNGTCVQMHEGRILYTLTFNSALLTSVRWLLPIVGGFLLQQRLKYQRALLIAACLLLATSATTSLKADLDGLACSAPLGWASTATAVLASGLVSPAILLGLALPACGDASLRHLVMAYMAASGLGDILGLSTRLLGDLTGWRLHWTCCVVAAAGLLAAGCLSDVGGGESRRLARSRMPSRLRVSQLVRAFALLPLAILVLSHGNQALARVAVKFFADWSDWRATLPQLTFEFVTVVGAAAVAVLPVLRDRRRRVLAGLCVNCLGHLALFGLTLPANGVDGGLLAWAHLTAAGLEGVTNVLSIGGVYELAVACSPRRCQAFAFGLLFTEWGIGSALSSLLTWALAAWPVSSPALQPSDGGARQNLFVAHGAFALLAALAAVHAFVATFPVADRLQVWKLDEDEDEEEDENEDEDEDESRGMRDAGDDLERPSTYGTL